MPHWPHIAKDVLQDPARTREQAAWELLFAVRELFPHVEAELRAVGDRLQRESDPELGDDHPANKRAEDRFARALLEWLTKYQLSCAAVEDAARKYAGGDSPSAGVYLYADFDDPEFRDRTPSITARPHDETRKEFVRRAGKYYDQVVAMFKAHGVKQGPVKRGRDHFRVLAAHLVGGHSWVTIANNPERFHLSAASEKTIAGEGRKTAALIGLSLRAKPGPRPGSRRRPPAHRVRPTRG